MSTRTTLRAKLTISFLGVAIGAVGAACVAFIAYDKQSSAESKAQVLQVLTRSVAGAAEGPTTFQDATSAARVLAWMAAEPTAEVASVYVEDGSKLAEWKRADGTAVPATRAQLEASGYGAHGLVVVQPIEAEGKAVGMLYARFSTADLKARTERFLRITGAVLGAAFVFAFLLARWLSGRISRPVAALATVAEQVRTTRDYTLRAEKLSDDELGVLTLSFNDMLAGIAKRDAELEHHRQHLEGEVKKRTADLDARNDQMRLVLDNVVQGFATIDLHGRLASERSLAFDRWFDRPAAERSFVDLVRAKDPKAAAWLDVALDGLRANDLPYEALLDQLPATLRRGPQTFAAEYRAIVRGEQVDSVLVMLTDVTERLERERAEQQQREMVIVFERLSKDRGPFLEFVEEVGHIVGRVTAKALGPTELFRALHTLKGSAGLYQLSSLSSLAHHLETQLQESSQAPDDEELATLAGEHERLRSMVDGFLGKRDGLLDVPRDDLESLKARIGRGEPRELILAWLREWSWEPASKRLEQVGEQARALARRLGKGEIQLVTEAGQLRLPPERLRAFWSAFSHVVRNAVDHGLEAPAARAAAGKPASGLVRLLAARTGDEVVVELADDGAGIDWERVRAKAQALGVACDTQQALERAIFHDGLSTRDAVSEVSGRGVGLAAVREIALELGGRVEVHSEQGKGTSFRFVFDAVELGFAPSAEGALPVEPRPSIGVAVRPSLQPGNVHVLRTARR